MVDFFFSFRFVLVFAICCAGLALIMFLWGLAAGGPANTAIAVAFLLVGLLGTYVGGVLKELTKRVEALESRGVGSGKRRPQGEAS